MADDTIKVDILTDSTSSTKSMIKYAAAVGGAYLAVNKIVNVSKELIAAYKVQEQAEAKLRSTLKATGNAAGFSFDQLKSYASGLQSITTYGDEVVLNGLSILSTFKSIQGDAFKRTTEAALDLSAVMGQDLQSSMVQLGKAVENPTVGLTALQRVGVTFTDQEKEQIKALQESNKLREAQAVILSAVEGQFKGAAQALAQTDTGKMEQLNNALGDLKEAMGKEIISNIVPFAGWLKTIAENATASLTATRSFAEYLKTGVSGTSLEAVNQQIKGAKLALDGLKLSTDALGNYIDPDAVKEAEDALYRLEKLATRIRRSGENAPAVLALQNEINEEKRLNEERKAQLEKDTAERLALEEANFAASLEASTAYWSARSEEEAVFQEALNNRKKADEEADRDERERKEEHFRALTDYYTSYTSMLTDTFAALGERMGESIIEQESMWDATGEIIKGAIAGIIRAMGSEALVEAAKNFAKGFAALANPFTASLAGGYFAAGAKWSAVGTLANVTAGMVNAKFAQGGEFITSGPQTIMVGDNATGRERVKVEPLGNESGQSGMIHNVIVLDGRPIADFITRASKDGRIITSARSVR